MSTRRLELGDLGHLVAAERTRRGFSLRQAADDIEIPFNTLARVEKGHIPDLQKFKKLVEWCGADIQQFLSFTRGQPQLLRWLPSSSGLTGTLLLKQRSG